MTIKEELSQEIESTPEPLLIEVLDFLRFIKSQQRSMGHSMDKLPQVSSSINSISTGRSLLEHLQTMGTWQGDDFEECLQTVYATRSLTKTANTSTNKETF